MQFNPGLYKPTSPTDQQHVIIDGQPVEVSVVSGSITVTVGSITVTTGTQTAITDGVDPTIKATVKDLSNSNPLTVAIVDTNGDQVASFGGGTQYADGASANPPTGNQINWNSNGTQAAVSTTKPLPTQLRDSSGTEIGTASTPVQVSLANTSTNAIAVKVDGSAVTQPISGTVTAVQSGTWQTVITSGTLSTLGTITNVVQVADNGGSLTVDGTVNSLQSGTWNIGTLGTVTNVVHVDDNGASLTVDGTVNVVQSGTWTVATVGTLTGITNVVHVDDNGGSLTVDGTVNAVQSGAWVVGTITNAVTVQQTTGSNLHTVVDSGTLTTVGTITNPVAVTQSGGWIIGTVTTVSALGSALPTGDNTIGRVKLTDGTTFATVRDLAANDALNVAIVDGSGNQITSFGGGTQYADGASAVTPTGNQINWNSAGTQASVSTTKPLPIQLRTSTGTETGLAAFPLQVSLANTGANATAVSTAETVPTSILHNQRTTTTGSRLQLSTTSAPIKSVTVKALSGNTQPVFVGSSTVNAANGFTLAANESVSMDISNLNLIYFDVTVNGEGVTYLAVN